MVRMRSPVQSWSVAPKNRPARGGFLLYYGLHMFAVSRNVLGAFVLVCLGIGGAFLMRIQVPLADKASSGDAFAAPVYASSWYDKSFFDRAYEQAQGESAPGVIAGLSAHHLLVADKMAATFEAMRNDEVKTIVLIGPNHFSMGMSEQQVSFGSWGTPYGIVETDRDAAEKLLAAVPSLRHEEVAFSGEHSIGVLTPFVARSFPQAKIVPIILGEKEGEPSEVTSAHALALGEAIARELPGALVVASVDMVHGQPTNYTAEQDELILALLDRQGWCEHAVCDFDLPIDSNPSLRALFAFLHAREVREWQLVYHGSSLEMGATRDTEENVSHILGVFK